MSDANKVVWSEGLFLRTQHFQQQDRHTEALVRGVLQSAPHQAWGFASLTLDGAAAGAGRIAIESAAGILPDGTPFSIPETMALPEPVAPEGQGASGLVELAVPLVTPGSATVAPAHAEVGGARYHGTIVNVRDTVRGGAEAEDIEVARLQPRLILPGQSTGGYTTLAVARIDGLRADGSVALSEGFLPPALRLDAVPAYGKLLQEVATGLDRIAEAHGKLVLGGAGRSVENLLILELANAARPRLAHMLEQGLTHPSELYGELVGLAGRMATYGSGTRTLSAFPVYDHADPQPAYSAVADTLRSLILSLRHVEPKSRALAVAKHSTNVWKVRIDNPDILRSNRIVLRVGSDLSDEALRKIFVNQATVGAADEFEGLWKARLPGIPLKPLHSQPREIPYDGDRLCLELDRRSEHWASLAEAPGFVIGVSGNLSGEPVIDCFAVNR